MRTPFSGLLLAMVAVLGSLGLLAERRHTLAAAGILVCATVMTLEGVALAVDWRGQTTAIRQRLIAGRSQALANMPSFVFRYVGLTLVVMGVGAFISDLRNLS